MDLSPILRNKNMSNENEKIYIIGHKSPDLDSVASAIAYAWLKNTFEKTDKYVPAVAGSLNKETDYILKKYSFDKPELLDSIANKNIILVDHNDPSQSADGVEEAEIIEVLDHHTINFSYKKPIDFRVRPWGSTCTLITQMAMNMGLKIEKEMASLMLSAVLVDTVIGKSPTFTPVDQKIIDYLKEIAQIDDWKAFGMEIFKVRSNVSELSPEEIIMSDFKDFEFKGYKFGIGQVETVDLNDLAEKESEILNKLEEIRKEKDYHTITLFITDIIKEGSLFLVSSQDMDSVEKALGTKITDNKVYIDGIISRKKQVLPMFDKQFNK